LIDLSGKPDLRWLSSLVADIRGAAPRSEFVLTGAKARDLLVTYAYNIPIERVTEDVDLAFAVAGWDEFLSVRQALLASGKFSERGKVPHRIQHRGLGTARIDLIPFAGVEDAKRQIAWPPDGAMVMNVVGFREAHSAAIRVALPEAEWINVAPLHALMLLKLAAWCERRLTTPGKDAQDIRLFFKRYLEAGNQERLSTEASHLLDEPDFDFEAASAWLLRCDAGSLLRAKATGDAAGFFVKVVEQEVQAGTESRLLADMRSVTPSQDMRLLEEFHKGLRAGLSRS
jgi:predicted nucleotidyltransferase